VLLLRACLVDDTSSSVAVSDALQLAAVIPHTAATATVAGNSFRTSWYFILELLAIGWEVGPRYTRPLPEIPELPVEEASGAAAYEPIPRGVRLCR
jgi:hypothetical protein